MYWDLLLQSIILHGLQYEQNLEWVNLTQITIISTTEGKNPLEEGHHSQQESLKCSTWMQPQKQQNDLCSFPRQTIQYHGNSGLCPNQ